MRTNKMQFPKVQFVPEDRSVPPYRMVVNGGSPKGEDWFKDLYEVKSGIYAIQDFHLGIYDIPSPGLHLAASIDKNKVNHAGYVHCTYNGRMLIQKPADGWGVLNYDAGSWTRGTFVDASHHDNAARKHNFIERLANGEGFTLCLGPRTRNILKSAMNIIRISFTDMDKALHLRKIAIGSAMDYNDTVENIDKTSPAPKEVLIKDVNGLMINLFDLLEGTKVGFYDRNGSELRDRFWNPHDENVVKVWADFAKKGHVIALR